MCSITICMKKSSWWLIDRIYTKTIFTRITSTDTKNFNIEEWQSKVTLKGGHFYDRTIFVFLPNTCWPAQVWQFGQTNSNDMTSMRFMCLIPHGLLAWTTPKQSVSLKQIQLRAFQTRHIIWSLMPLCLGPAITAFCSLYKHDSDAAFNNVLKTNDMNKNIQNHDCKMMIILQKWK